MDMIEILSDKQEEIETTTDKTTKFEDVKDQTTEEYFKGNQFSIDAFNKKYTSIEGESYVQALKRVCDYISSVEKTEELRQFWSERWFDEIYNDWWHPAGSIMQGAGTHRKISLANCTTISLGALRNDEEWDNLESIFKNTAYTVAKCAAYRQGLGVDFSRLRPNGTKVLNSANQSTGAVHWMKHVDGIGYSVGQKGRIPAMLFSLSITHPDIEEFITIKSDYTKIQNANISVQITDKFYRAVEEDKDWDLYFDIPSIKKGDKVYIDVHSIDVGCTKEKETGRYYKIATHDRKKEFFTRVVKAKKLLELIAKNMSANAEPGIQNIDIARRYSNSDYMYDPSDEYDSRILSTNACSEQYLSRESLCVLASLNVEKFDTSPYEYIPQLEKIASSMQRFLDNVNECELHYETFATPHQKLAIQKLRRIGAGVTNIVAWLFKQNLLYGTQEANDAFEEFQKVNNYFLYLYGEKVGKEKSDFGLFNKEKWKSSPFVKRMIEESHSLNEKYELDILTGNHSRNVTYSSIAPTGTLSLMFRDMVFSYGIEPAWFLYFWKRTRMAGKYEYYFCVPKVVIDAYEVAGFPIPIDSDTIRDDWDGKHGKVVAQFIEDHKSDVGVKFENSTEIDPLDKLQFMSQIMKWVDSSISTTYLLPEGSDWKSVYKFIIEAHKKEVKSIAAFPDKKMYGIVSSTAFKDLAFKLKSEGIDIHHQNFSDIELKELNISRQKIAQVINNSPTRLDTLEADIYTVSVKGQKFVIVVGIQNGQPYEIFGGHLNGLGLKSAYKKGKITKMKKGQYSLDFDDINIEDFSKQFTPTEQILFRMASMGLRHGVPIQFIVEQLQKATEDITSMASAAARVLKKYIKDGEKVHGQSCPSCKSVVVYIEGCVSCPTCGWSKCS
jgi:ribonucleoside-diphosphate reductase alpha chain